MYKSVSVYIDFDHVCVTVERQSFRDSRNNSDY